MRRIRRDAIVLLYHRVADAPRDPYQLCVSPANFEEQLAVACRVRTPVPLHLIVRRLVDRRSVRGLLAVTFDDGYADNLLTAAAILERYTVPATLFAVSGMIGSTGEFWWDELERVLLDTPQAPPTLELSIGGERHRWRLEDGHYGSLSGARPGRDGVADARFAPVALRTLAAHMEASPATEKARLLAALRTWSGGERPARRSQRCLTHEELGTFDRHPLFDVGAHTVNHPVLPDCGEAMRREIASCKETLEALLGHAVDGFSYPHGRHDEATRACVAASGHTYACCSDRSAVRARSDRFAIPRRVVADHDGARFARWLS